MMKPITKNLRRSHLALALLASGLSALALMTLHAQIPGRSGELAAHANLVTELGLTDLALFTEARYTRHPSQADLHSPFQDHPMSFDHFPTGSLIGPSRNFGGTRFPGKPTQQGAPQ